MKEKAGAVFSIADENKPVPGCTLSKLVSDAGGYGISYFSLAAGTDISPETYAYPKLIFVAGGSLELTGGEAPIPVKAGEAVVTPVGAPVGCATTEGAVYTEISLLAGSKLGPGLAPGKVFAPKNLLPCLPDRILNTDLVKDPGLKFVVMSFGAGTGLSEHAAPGDALVFALAGEGILGYEGKEFAVRPGETFKFAKNARHWVKAPKDFKMALLLELAA